MPPGDGGVAVAVTKINVLPLFSRAEQLPFKIPVHVPADNISFRIQAILAPCKHALSAKPRVLKMGIATVTASDGCYCAYHRSLYEMPLVNHRFTPAGGTRDTGTGGKVLQNPCSSCAEFMSRKLYADKVNVKNI